MESGKRWYRRFELDVDRETIRKAVANTTDPAVYGVSALTGPYLTPDVDDLVGRTLIFRGEGRQMSFRFAGRNELYFAEEAGAEKTCYCNVKTMDGEVYLVNQLIPGYELSRQVTLVADMRTGAATVCDAHIGTEHSNLDVGREFIFGRLDGDFAEGPLHHFTDEMTGKAIEWDYGPGVSMPIKHMYVSNLYYTYGAPASKGAWMATNPADYIKLREGLFLFSFVEERQHGLQGLFVIDLKTYHDIGCFYGLRGDRLTSACLGARGTPAELTSVF